MSQSNDRSPSRPQNRVTSRARDVEATPGRRMIANPKTPKSPYLSALEAIQRGKATPSRRKSLKHIRQRESPWDVLKLLSRTLAPKTLPPPASPTTPAEPGPTKRTSRRSSVTFFEESSNYDNDDDDDTGELPPAPRLSMDLNSLVDQENERFARREIPRSSLLPEDIHTGDHSEQSLSPPITVRSAEDVDTTAREIELPRRAVSERPMFDIRLSDRFHDLDRMQRIDRENARRESTIFGGTDRRESMGLNFRDNDDPAPDGVYYSSDDDNEQFDQLHYGDNTENVRNAFSAIADDDNHTTRFNHNQEPGDLTMDTSFQLDMPQDDNEYGNDDAGGGAANDIGNLDSRYGGRRDEEDDDGGMDYELDNDQRGFRVSSIRPIHPNTLPTTTTATSKRTTRTRTKKLLKISPHTSLPISTFPHRITKKLATTFSNGMGGTLGKETLAMIQEAGERFLENLSTDCADYAAHGKRGGRIEEGDVLMLFKRQRLVNGNTTTAFSLADKYLPRELMQELRMPTKKVKAVDTMKKKKEDKDKANTDSTMTTTTGVLSRRRQEPARDDM